MEAQSQPLLTIETFLAVAEMVAQQLRIKESDRWSSTVCQLKYVSFLTDFPEVNDQQLFWSAERWLQSKSEQEFLRYPTWTELMSPLYRCENGLANREWGFKDELPAMVQPTYQQLQMLPRKPEPPKALPSGEPTYHGLSKQMWADYLRSLTDES